MKQTEKNQRGRRRKGSEADGVSMCGMWSKNDEAFRSILTRKHSTHEMRKVSIFTKSKKKPILILPEVNKGFRFL